MHVLAKLSNFVASADGDIDATQASAWIPTPAELSTLDKAWCSYSHTLMNVLALGARAFERLGRDDDAAAAAQLGIDIHKKKAVRSDCQCLLGRVLARRGDQAGAGAAFRAAAELAREARMPVLELLAGRDLKRHVRGATEEGDALIDGACARMGKERARFADLLAT